ncbi:MAG: potassium channel family protein [Erysipelotrichaceae bacterium]
MKKINTKQYAILGLGIFGSSVAKTLSEYHCEVLAIDQDIKNVERVSEYVTTAVQADITQKEELMAAGVSDCDVAIIAVGSHLEDSVICAINLKEMGVPYVVAKAKNKRYMQILEKVGVDYIVRPEKEIGERLAKKLLSKNIVDISEIDSDYTVLEIEPPHSWIGKSLSDLDLRMRYQINVIGIRSNCVQCSNSKLQITFDANYTIHQDDHLLVIAEISVIEDIDKIN